MSHLNLTRSQCLNMSSLTIWAVEPHIFSVITIMLTPVIVSTFYNRLFITIASQFIQPNATLGCRVSWCWIIVCTPTMKGSKKIQTGSASETMWGGGHKPLLILITFIIHPFYHVLNTLHTWSLPFGTAHEHHKDQIRHHILCPTPFCSVPQWLPHHYIEGATEFLFFLKIKGEIQ